MLWEDGKQERSSALSDWMSYYRRTETLPSQRVFRASLDGKHLGWVDQNGTDLHIRDVDGKEQIIKTVWRNDWRFSGDGKRVAAIVGVAAPDIVVVVLDLATGTQKDLGHVSSPDQIDWTKDGVVVHEWDDGKDRLTYLPLDGDRRVLVEKMDVSRFATAWDGSDVYFARARAEDERVYRVSVTGGKPEELGTLDGVAVNAEVTPDGSRAAFATKRNVYLVEDGRVRRVSTEDDVSTLWFSPDGKRLAFVSSKQATVHDGDEVFTLKQDKEQFKSARFIDSGHDLLIASNKRILRWDPAANAGATMASAPDGAEFLAADVVGDDLVLWASRRDDAGRNRE